MCLDCNCGKPNDDHGDPAHITYQKLEAAARASGIDPEEAADRIHAGNLATTSWTCVVR